MSQPSSSRDTIPFMQTGQSVLIRGTVTGVVNGKPVVKIGKQTFFGTPVLHHANLQSMGAAADPQETTPILDYADDFQETTPILD